MTEQKAVTLNEIIVGVAAFFDKVICEWGIQGVEVDLFTSF